MKISEFETEMIEDADISGYSEKRTDKQIDRKDDGNQGVKQFNRLTKRGSFIPPKKVKKDDKKDIKVVFESK